MNPANRVPEPRWPLTVRNECDPTLYGDQTNRPTLPPLVDPGPRIDPATLAVWVAVVVVPFGSVVAGVADTPDQAAEMLGGRDGAIIPFYVNAMPDDPSRVYGRTGQHRPVTGDGWCTECGREWPCHTRRQEMESNP